MTDTNATMTDATREAAAVARRVAAGDFDRSDAYDVARTRTTTVMIAGGGPSAWIVIDRTTGGGATAYLRYADTGGTVEVEMDTDVALAAVRQMGVDLWR